MTSTRAAALTAKTMSLFRFLFRDFPLLLFVAKRAPLLPFDVGLPVT